MDKDNKTKILLVGDSFAEGFGVEENERFGNIIEENRNELRNKGIKRLYGKEKQKNN